MTSMTMLRRGGAAAARPHVPLPARLFVALVPVLAAAVWLTLQLLHPLTVSEWERVGLWLVLGLLAHAGEFELTLPSRTRLFMSAGFAVSAAAIADLPPAGAILAVALGSLTWQQVHGLCTGRLRPQSVLFNRGMLGLCAATGAAVFWPAFAWLAPLGPALPSAGAPGPLLRLVVSSAVASAAYFAANVGLVGAVVALREAQPPRRPWLWPLAVSPTLLWNQLSLGLLGDLILTMQRVGGVVGLGLALIPLAVTYFSLRQHAATSRLYDAIVATLADSLDLRDHDTGGHTRRTAALAVRLGQRLGLRGQALSDLRTAALLHDLGKIGVADAILLKPTGLDGREWAAMRRHPDLGAELLAAHGLLAGAVPMIRHHQEHYDGSGYPGGLVGEAIPLGARIIAVADAFMAMVDGRPYRAGIAPEVAWRELQRQASRQFDPKVVAALHPDDWRAVFTEMPPQVERQLVRA